MSVKSLSAPKNAAYPLVVRKTLVAPEEIVCRGQLLYEIEDAQGRRMEVKTPFSGSIMGKPIATGTVLKSPQIILEIDESKAGEVEEAWMEKIPAEGSAPAPQKTGASSSADPPRSPSSSHERPGWHRVVGVFAFLLGPFLTWIALHLTHSLAGAGYRFGGLAIALLAPWLLYSVLPHKRNRRSATSVYRVAGGKGSITSVILIVASLILPPKVLSSGDCMWVHRLFAPITFAPLLEKGGRIYLLGRHVADLAEGTKGVPLSNGGLVTRWWGMGINEGYTGAVWSPRGAGDPRVGRIQRYPGLPDEAWLNPDSDDSHDHERVSISEPWRRSRLLAADSRQRGENHRQDKNVSGLGDDWNSRVSTAASGVSRAGSAQLR